MRTGRLLVVAVLVTCAPFAAVRANAQTRNLTVNGAVDRLSIAGTPRQCSILQLPCVVTVNDGATVRISAADTNSSASAAPGNFSGGTGPAAGCALSTCTITMTA